jgi:hypothetical protein
MFGSVRCGVYERQGQMSPMREEPMMAARSLRIRRIVLPALLVSSCGLLSSVGAAKPATWLMTFTIDQSEGHVLSGDPAGVYKDFRLGSGLPDDVNYCVEASPSPGLFIRLNRKLDGANGSQYCGLFGGTPRQYFVTISNAAACSELWAGGYPTGPEAPCVFTGADKPRIDIANDLYGKRTTRTPMKFLSKWYDVNAVSYEIRPESDATVISTGIDPSMRIVSYSGSARLWRFDPGVQARAVAEAFPMPFQMTFRRTAQ